MSNSEFTPFPRFEPITIIGRRFQNLTGQRFGNLLVIGLAGGIKHRAMWFYLCDCGTFRWASTSNLKRGNSTSCGCENRDAIGNRSRKHGLSRSPEWNSWNNAKERCYRKENIGYSNYGGRGITMCAEWLGEDGFNNFLKHIGPKPSPIHSLDRINSNGNYEPGNVRWATPPEQSTNRRTTRFLTFNDTTLPLSHWAKAVGLSESGLRRRLSIGMPLEIALTLPKIK